MEEWNFKFQKLKRAYGGGSAPGYDNRGKIKNKKRKKKKRKREREGEREREKRKQQNHWND